MPRSLPITSGTPKQIRSILGEALYCGFHICKTTCLLDLYFGNLWGKVFLEFFTPKGTVLDKELSLLPLPLSDSQNNAGDLDSLLKMCRLDCLWADASSAKVTAQRSVSGALEMSWSRAESSITDDQSDGDNSSHKPEKHPLLFTSGDPKGAPVVAKGSERGMTSFSTMASGKGVTMAKAKPSCKWDIPGGPGLPPSVTRKACPAGFAKLVGVLRHKPRPDGQLAECHRPGAHENF